MLSSRRRWRLHRDRGVRDEKAPENWRPDPLTIVFAHSSPERSARSDSFDRVAICSMRLARLFLPAVKGSSTTVEQASTTMRFLSGRFPRTARASSMQLCSCVCTRRGDPPGFFYFFELQCWSSRARRAAKNKNCEWNWVLNTRRKSSGSGRENRTKRKQLLARVAFSDCEAVIVVESLSGSSLTRWMKI